MPDLSSASLPSALRAQARWMKLRQTIPAMLVHPTWDASKPVPVVLWMHGRTVNKELDPGRYLRWMRSSEGGIGACAVDLPGHGERFDPQLQQPERSLDVVRQMVDEIDSIVESIAAMGVFDMNRIAIGGVSAGGMAALVRLCRPHEFRCVSVEATTGSWLHQRARPMFAGMSEDQINKLNPIAHLENWRPIPFQAFHSKLDAWIAYSGQAEFIESLRQRYTDHEMIDFVTYEQTGAPHEHIGFGKRAAEAKDRQREFLQRWL